MSVTMIASYPSFQYDEWSDHPIPGIDPGAATPSDGNDVCDRNDATAPLEDLDDFIEKAFARVFDLAFFIARVVAMLANR